VEAQAKANAEAERQAQQAGEEWRGQTEAKARERTEANCRAQEAAEEERRRAEADQARTQAKAEPREEAMLLTRSQVMKSSLKMQQIQPQMEAIKAKYAKYRVDDPRHAEMFREILELLKREGVRMLGADEFRVKDASREAQG